MPLYREPRHVGCCCRLSRLVFAGQGKCDRIVGATEALDCLRWRLRSVRLRFRRLQGGKVNSIFSKFPGKNKVDSYYGHQLLGLAFQLSSLGALDANWTDRTAPPTWLQLGLRILTCKKGHQD